MRMARMHSLKTPSRSTMRSWVRSSPSRWTFQYIQCDGAITGIWPGLSVRLRISSASLRGDQLLCEQAPGACSRLSARLSACANSAARYSRIFLRMNMRVGADINDPLLLEQPLDERLDLRINERLAAADRNHRRVALLRRTEAVFERHHVLERGGILADAAAAGAGEVAGVQRFELENGRELLRPAQFLPDDVSRDLGG